jgi:Uma2 family endonuclease
MHRMTAAEFANLPSSGDYIAELHNGALVLNKRPNKRQDGRLFRVRRALQAWADEAGILSLHFPFCPLPDYEVRVADLAFITQARWDAAPQDGYFPGSPDWVIEVLSKDDAPEAIAEKRQICLANGCQQFWLVDNEKERVEVTRVEVTTSAGTKTYRPNDHIPLDPQNQQFLSAARLFPQH